MRAVSQFLTQALVPGVVLALSAVASQAAPQYRVQLLLSGPHQDFMSMSRATAISDDGTAVIQQDRRDSAAGTASFRCRLGEECQWVGGFSDASYQYVQAWGINASGWIVGGGFRYGLTQAFLNDGQTVHAIGYMRGTCDGCGAFLASTAYAINRRGIVVGDAVFQAGQPMRAFRRTDTEFRDLGTLGGPYSEARAINDRGQVVGSASLADEAQQHAYRWSSGVMTDLGTLGGQSSWAYGINRSGAVVGCSEQGDGRPHTAFVWRAETGMQSLGEGHAGACALALNDKGVIVGYAVRKAGRKQVAVRYHNGRAVDLNTLLEPVSAADWQLTTATAINASGVIAGNGLYQGHSRAFRLVPIDR